MFGFLQLPAVKVSEQVTGAALQVRAGEVEVEVRDQAAETAVLRRLPEVL